MVSDQDLLDVMSNQELLEAARESVEALLSDMPELSPAGEKVFLTNACMIFQTAANIMRDMVHNKEVPKLH